MYKSQKPQTALNLLDLLDVKKGNFLIMVISYSLTLLHRPGYEHSSPSHLFPRLLFPIQKAVSLNQWLSNCEANPTGEVWMHCRWGVDNQVTNIK